MPATLQNGIIRVFYKDQVGNEKSRTYPLSTAKMTASDPELAGIADGLVAGLTNLVGAEITKVEVGGVYTEAASAPLKDADATDHCSVHSAVKVPISNSGSPTTSINVEFLGTYRNIYQKRLGSDKFTVLPISHNDTPATPGEFLHAMLTDQAGTGNIQFSDSAGNVIDTVVDGLHSTKESSVSPGVKEG